ncbi:phosphotransferase family protein [Marinovum sp.]|uniref:phosphotransferase family protein n=1 Tax=Marinovum sp. TaxID=2024839 RepID=UPI003A92A2D3
MQTSIHAKGDLDFDPSALHGFLSQTFGSGEADMEIERISGGQSNPTYFVTHGPRRMVLRKQPNGPLLKGAHAIDREYRVLRALKGTDVPVPEVLLYHADPGLVGTPFYLMERVEGRIFTDCALPELAVEERREIYMGLADAMARMHSVRPEDIGLADYGRPGNYFARQLARWSKQWQAAESAPIPELDKLGAWLAENLPEDGPATIAHGDFRLGNMIYHPEKPEVVAILDWELSTLGDPLADLGFCVMPWNTAPEEYGGTLGKDLAALGLPDEEDFVARYMAGRAGSAPLAPFHKAFALYRFAVIFVGIAERVRTGNAAGTNASDLAPLARSFAVRGWNIARTGHPTGDLT